MVVSALLLAAAVSTANTETKMTFNNCGSPRACSALIAHSIVTQTQNCWGRAKMHYGNDILAQKNHYEECVDDFCFQKCGSSAKECMNQCEKSGHGVYHKVNAFMQMHVSDAIENPDELDELKTVNPTAYGIVKALLTKRAMGLLNTHHPSSSMASTLSFTKSSQDWMKWKPADDSNLMSEVEAKEKFDAENAIAPPETSVIITENAPVEIVKTQAAPVAASPVPVTAPAADVPAPVAAPVVAAAQPANTLTPTPAVLEKPAISAPATVSSTDFLAPLTQPALTADTSAEEKKIGASEYGSWASIFSVHKAQSNSQQSADSTNPYLKMVGGLGTGASSVGGPEAQGGASNPYLGQFRGQTALVRKSSYLDDLA